MWSTPIEHFAVPAPVGRRNRRADAAARRTPCARERRRSARRLSASFLAILLGSALLGSAISFAATRPQVAAPAAPATDPEPWIGDVEEVVTDRALGFALLERVRRAVRGETLPAASDALREQRAARVVFISWSDGDAPARTAAAGGIGWWAALDRALARARAAGLRGHPWVLRLDLLRSTRPVALRDGDAVPGFDRTRDGLALRRELGLVLLDGQLQVTGVIDGEGVFRRARLDALLAGRVDPGAGALSALAFRTHAFALVAGSPYELAAGRRRQERVGVAECDAALAAAEQYLLLAMDGEGRFAYEQDAYSGRLSRDYNLLRHAGTLWAMLQLYEWSGRPETLAAADRGIGFLRRATRPWVASGAEAPVRVVVDRGKVKLGGAALGVLALTAYARHSDDADALAQAQALARYIVSIQRHDGAFQPHVQTWVGRVDTRHTSDYYPGEADLALVTLFEADGDTRWLQAARRNVRYLTEVRDAGRSSAQEIHDHWLLYALERLQRADPSPADLLEVRRIVRAIVDGQVRRSSRRELIGGWPRAAEGRITPAATRSEGLAAAYRTLHGHASRAELAEIRAALERAARFQLAGQFRRESAMFLRFPRRFVGGFREHLAGGTIRIDGVQHNASSLLALREILVEKKR